MSNSQQAGLQPHIEDFYRDETLNPLKVDDLLKKEMMSMSATDRNAISEEMHGVRCLAPIESKELLEKALRELDSELSRIPPNEKRAFLQATTSSRNGAYVDTDEFRLRFLRCELFDAQKAARRLVNYLDFIAYYLPFETGLEVLKRPITLTDFTEAERNLLRKGHMQLLPFRDRSGRRVLAGVASLGIRFEPNMWYKIILYFLWSASDDVESQQKGIVVLLWPNPDIAKSFKLRYPINSGGRIMQMVLQCAPIRMVAIHFCAPANDPFFKIVQSVLALTIAGGRRSRFKVHSGGPIELKYQIKSYGIPVDLLPLTSTGNVKITYLKQWIRLRSISEEELLQNAIRGNLGMVPSAASASSICMTASTDSTGREALIECPGSKDVVFRPGKPVMNHPGNVTFRSLIESKAALHDLATQTGKANIAREVVDEMILAQGGRFLVWEENSCCWKAITEPTQQRNKVAIAFRNFKSYRKALVNRQTVTEPEGALTGTVPGEGAGANDAGVRAMIFGGEEGPIQKRARSCFQ